MNLLDLLYGKNRPPAVSAADMQAKMQALADDANRKAAEMEKEDATRKRDRAGRR